MPGRLVDGLQMPNPQTNPSSRECRDPYAVAGVMGTTEDNFASASYGDMANT